VDGGVTLWAAGSPRAESEHERLNRNFAELLQEVRVVVAGVQILFAFLLTLPFTAKSDELAGRHVVAYAVSVSGSAVATVLLLGTVSYHRLVFRGGRKPDLVRVASRLAQAGLAAFGLALVSACFLIGDVVLGPAWGAGFGGLVLALVAVVWYSLPGITARRPDVGEPTAAPARTTRSEPGPDDR
jgi:O-antigen/teichoic acid export membrane protein